MTLAAETASIAASLAVVRGRIARAAERAGRDPASVTLVGVSKTMPPERVQAAYDAGLRHFGENRVQEGVAKVEALRLPDATWHLIGHLQTNKAKAAARAFDVVHSADSTRVADALAQHASGLKVLLEVNYAAEESKFGVAPDEAAALAAHVRSLPGLRLVGLMTVAPHVEDAEQVRPIFRGMRELGERLRHDAEEWHLSMGMTNDFEVAIGEGATIVRVGRAIFGERG
jgi:pyridoxal phosphate enzyme (YggS family)